MDEVRVVMSSGQIATHKGDKLSWVVDHQGHLLIQEGLDGGKFKTVATVAFGMWAAVAYPPKADV